MRTILEFKTGHGEVLEGTFPDFTLEDDPTICCVDKDGHVVTDEIPLEIIKRVIWEAD